jgi:hypothetical protein
MSILGDTLTWVQRGGCRASAPPSRCESVRSRS